MKFKKSIIIPSALLIYLIIMACISFDEFINSGKYFYYWGVIGGSLLVIVLLHLSLKHKEKLQKERENDLNKNDGD